MPKDSEHRKLVPVLMQTLDIPELLLRTNAPLKMNEISHTTGSRRRRTGFFKPWFVEDILRAIARGGSAGWVE